MKIFILICWLKTINYTFFKFDGLVKLTNLGAITSGHNFVEQEDGSLKCKLCKHISN